MDWRHQAACRGTDPELFYAFNPDQLGEVKKVCADCPVREQCRQFALETGQDHGVWGGLDDAERRALRRRRPHPRRTA